MIMNHKSYMIALCSIFLFGCSDSDNTPSAIQTSSTNTLSSSSTPVNTNTLSSDDNSGKADSSASTASSASSQSSDDSSSSSTEPAVSCEQAAELGLALYNNNCTQCHGAADDIPTDGTTRWTSPDGNTIDVFDSDGDGYQPRDPGSPQMLAFNEFIAMFMPNMAMPIGNDNNEADYIAAFISSKVKQPWCPGTDWPDPQTSSSSSSIANPGSTSSSSSGTTNFSSYKKGSLLYSEDFEDNDSTPWQRGEATNGIYRIWKGSAGDSAAGRLSAKSDENGYTDPKTMVELFPTDFTNVIIEFDILFKAYIDADGMSFGPASMNILIDDTYSSDYTHASHISRIQLNPKNGNVLLRDDIGGVFGKKRAEVLFKDQGDEATFNQIVAGYYTDEVLETKMLRTKVDDIKVEEMAADTWHSLRIVMFGSRMELWVDNVLAAALDSPGTIDVNNPIAQPEKPKGVTYGRENIQPRGLDHYKNKWGFTTNPGEANVDNIKIWEVLPE